MNRLSIFPENDGESIANLAVSALFYSGLTEEAQIHAKDDRVAKDIQEAERGNLRKSISERIYFLKWVKSASTGPIPIP